MLDMDCKHQRKHRRRKVSESTLLETARYIADSWKQDMPGYTADDSPEKELPMILDFMRKCGIQTKEDYEDFLIKEHQTE